MLSCTPSYRARDIAVKLGFKDSKAQGEAADIMQKLYTLFKDTDATQVEINPLSETAEGVMCMDAKLGFDENAEFRQEKVFSMRDKTQEDPAEVCLCRMLMTYWLLIDYFVCTTSRSRLPSTV